MSCFLRALPCRAAMNTAHYYIQSLQLSPHPEGGYYRETYRSPETVPAGSVSQRFNGSRSCCTGIFYLLQAGDYSAFHRIKSDEMWHFYAGYPLEVHMLDHNGHSVIELGSDLQAGQQLQAVVPADTWFAATPKQGSAFSLVGCTVSPGFDFQDFELARASQIEQLVPSRAEELLRRFPPRDLR